MDLRFTRLTQPTPEIAAAYTKWENDPALVHLTRPNQNQADLDRRSAVSVDDLTQRLEHHHIYLIYMDSQLIGEMDYQIDPQHLFRKETGTAWIGITLGEASARGKGLGDHAMRFLEEEIKTAGFKRIELGVFEFNQPAQKLYLKMGYSEIGRIPGFTYWQGKMWTDIRLEKYLQSHVH